MLYLVVYIGFNVVCVILANICMHIVVDVVSLYIYIFFFL